jgi:hypothetical protein
VQLGVPVDKIWNNYEKESEHRREMERQIFNAEAGDRIEERRVEKAARLAGIWLASAALSVLTICPAESSSRTLKLSPLIVFGLPSTIWTRVPSGACSVIRRSPR